jgi:hypothetical protein
MTIETLSTLELATIRGGAGSLDRYKNAIHSRPGGDAYASALQCRDLLPTK